MPCINHFTYINLLNPHNILLRSVLIVPISQMRNWDRVGLMTCPRSQCESVHGGVRFQTQAAPGSARITTTSYRLYNIPSLTCPWFLGYYQFFFYYNVTNTSSEASEALLYLSLFWQQNSYHSNNLFSIYFQLADNSCRNIEKG